MDAGCCGTRKDRKLKENKQQHFHQNIQNENQFQHLQNEPTKAGVIHSPGTFIVQQNSVSPGNGQQVFNYNHSFSYGSDEKLEIFQNEPLPIIQNLSINDGFYIQHQENYNLPQFRDISNPVAVNLEFPDGNGANNINNNNKLTYKEFLKNQKEDSCSQTDSKGSGQAQRSIKLWTPEEDRLLVNLHRQFNGHWNEIVQKIPGRNQSQCTQRWRRIRPQKQRKPWQKEEDDLVIKMVIEQRQNWGEIASQLDGRTGQQIRERFINKLDPRINQGRWSIEEDNKIIQLYNKIGSKWSEISKHLIGRPENMIKNRFYSHIRRVMQLQEGSDAVKYSPKNDFASSYEESDAQYSDSSSKRGEFLTDENLKEDFAKLDENQYSNISSNIPIYGEPISLENRQMSPRIQDQVEQSGISTIINNPGTTNRFEQYQQQQIQLQQQQNFLYEKKLGGSRNSAGSGLRNSGGSNNINSNVQANGPYTHPFNLPQTTNINNGFPVENQNILINNNGTYNNQNQNQNQNYDLNYYSNQPVVEPKMRLSYSDYLNGMNNNVQTQQPSAPQQYQSNLYMNGNFANNENLNGLKRSTYSNNSAPAYNPFQPNQARHTLNNYSSVPYDDLSNHSDLSNSFRSQNNQFYTLQKKDEDLKLDHLQKTQQELMNQLMGIQQEINNISVQTNERSSIRGQITSNI